MRNAVETSLSRLIDFVNAADLREGEAQVRAIRDRQLMTAHRTFNIIIGSARCNEVLMRNAV